MTAIASKGTVLQLEIASVYTDVVQVTEIDGPGPDVRMFEPLDLDGPTGVPKKPTGFVDGGSVTFGVYFDPVAATHQALTDLLATPAVVNWKTIWSDSASTEWPYAGTLTKFSPSAKPEDGLKASGEIMLDGIVTYPT